jgi:lipopolysaccharide/colanic/teichoic acid biosynthesis glycosyltransferase
VDGPNTAEALKIERFRQTYARPILLADVSAGPAALVVEPPFNARPRVEGVGSVPAPSALSRVGKRTLDIVVSAALLLIALPLILLVALLVRIDSRGPVLFRCDRVGHRGNRLRMLKFRKMRHDATGSALTMADDDRFTRVGRWLARLKFDELPQLWHVLRGEMSLVGPRPESEDFVAHYGPDYSVVLEAKPGIIGLSQLAFVDESRILDAANPELHYLRRIMPQKVGLDLVYVARRGVRTDLRILFWAVVVLLLRRDVAVRRETGTVTLRRRKGPPAKAVTP